MSEEEHDELQQEERIHRTHVLLRSVKISETKQVLRIKLIKENEIYGL